MDVSGQFDPQGKSPWYPLAGRLCGPQSLLDAVVKRKVPSPSRESNPRILIFQPVAQRYTDWTIKALFRNGNIFIETSCGGIERIVLLDFIHRLVSQKIEELKI
jgi:hypothetical protein